MARVGPRPVVNLRGGHWTTDGDLTSKDSPNHESAVITMAVDDDAQQQPRSAAANDEHQEPADHDEHGLLVTLRADLSDEDIDAVAQSIEEVAGVLAVQRYVADPTAAPRSNSTIPGGAKASSTS